MQPQITTLQQEFLQQISQLTSLAELESAKVKYLGKKGAVQQLMKDLKEVKQEERPLVGKWINDLKVEISTKLENLYSQLLADQLEKQLREEKLDITLPGRRRFAGRKHIITQTLDELIDTLAGMGFSVQYGPDIDTDYYNFEALNFPADHPARDMQDTFYITDNLLLRTHTSNVQVRVMEAQEPPIRVMTPGKVYRNETITARSHVFFHQLEGLYIDKAVTFADLFSTLKEFLSKIFHAEVETRFRPSYFPFVEPGLEVDLRCLTCQGEGCNLCKYTGWLEIGGAGMIHPEVLKNGGIDPEIYSGYAFGIGVERLILLKNGVKDIRLFTENDWRFLQQFGS